MKKSNFSRRDFLRKSASISGGSFLAYNSIAVGSNTTDVEANNFNINKLPRQITIGTVSFEEIESKNPMDMIGKVFDILKWNMPIYQPDIVCLPEIFPFVNNQEKIFSLKRKVEISSETVNKLSGYAKKYNCYVIAPLYTTENSKVFNSAVVLDRKGEYIGEYRKIHTTLNEMNEGVSPGSYDQPVFKTDFGTIGIQICFDIEWEDGWNELKEKGVDIIFWPSAFAGGYMLNAKAWQNRCVTVSSTWKDTSKICDMTGEVIAETGRWNMNFISGTVNLEKAFLHTWPAVSQFEAIKKKYGKKIQLKTFHEEEWSIIESLSPDVFVADILKEFNIKSRQQLLQDSENRQKELR